MLDFLKQNRFNKISADHSEPVSDKMIMYNIVNTAEARKNLSSGQFKQFMQIFNKYNSSKRETLCNSIQYEHRAFRIAYDFEFAGVPYDEICGQATDILYMYTNMKPKYDELINDQADDYIYLINGIVYRNPFRPKKEVYLYAAAFLYPLLSSIIQSSNDLKTDEFIKTLALFTAKKVSLKCYEKNGSGDLEKYVDKMNQINLAAYGNNTSLSAYITTYLQSFLTLIKCQNDDWAKVGITEYASEWSGAGKDGEPIETVAGNSVHDIRMIAENWDQLVSSLPHSAGIIKSAVLTGCPLLEENWTILIVFDNYVIGKVFIGDEGIQNSVYLQKYFSKRLGTFVPLDFEYMEKIRALPNAEKYQDIRRALN